MLDFVVNLLKWPAAISAVLLAPSLAWTSWELLGWIIVVPSPLTGFALGAVGYSLAWWVLLKRRFVGSLLSTTEHELTHAVFAWLTLHRVSGFRATWNSGGHVLIRNGGNWLIDIAPYWFPTFTIPFLVVMAFSLAPQGTWPTVGLGAAFAYHVISTRRETHRQQTDLQRTGFTFAWMLLPTANLLVLSLLLAYAHGGGEEVTRFVATWGSHSVQVAQWVARHIGGIG